MILSTPCYVIKVATLFPSYFVKVFFMTFHDQGQSKDISGFLMYVVTLNCDFYHKSLKCYIKDQGKNHSTYTK